MWDQLLKMAMSKLDPVVAAAFVTRCNNALAVQERGVKAQEDIADHLADLVEILKTRVKK